MVESESLRFDSISTMPNDVEVDATKQTMRMGIDAYALVSADASQEVRNRVTDRTRGGVM